MGKYKVAVYAITKNEEKFVDRWYESMKEADNIYVLDTGSTDKTVSKLKEKGIIVKTKEIVPWRFDIARNESLKLIPDDYDICVCTDLDEILNKGWREELEKYWDNSNRIKYIYNWSHDKFNNPNVTFLYQKIHDRKHYKWKYPVHEILECSLKNEKVKEIKSIVLDHYPDPTKSRSSYLQLLELSYKENPNDERTIHYLGREYMFHKEYEKCIETLLEHIKISTWDLEKNASMRYIARSYKELGRYEESELWYKKAIKLCPNSKEGYIELALLKLIQKDYLNTIYYSLKSKTLSDNGLVYINEPFCKDNTVDDILSIAYYNIGLKEEALLYIDKALSYDNTDERLINNKKIFAK